jgi:hypothetical protein
MQCGELGYQVNNLSVEFQFPNVGKLQIAVCALVDVAVRLFGDFAPVFGNSFWGAQIPENNFTLG